MTASGRPATVCRVADDPQPPWIAPFVLETPAVRRERHGTWDLFDPEAAEPRPLVMFVHGGPVPPQLPAPPRDWHVFRGYGALTARHGAVGATVDHRLHTPAMFGLAYQDVLDAIEELRTDPRVDGDRVAVWVFSGGGPFVAPLLADPPPWLRVIAATYPILDDRPERELPEGFRPLEAVAHLPRPMPFVLTRAGLEDAEAAAGVARFLDAASGTELKLTVVDQLHGRHGFDAMDYGDESQEAVRAALAAVVEALAG